MHIRHNNAVSYLEGYKRDRVIKALPHMTVFILLHNVGSSFGEMDIVMLYHIVQQLQ